jgi:hypothetical protein
VPSPGSRPRPYFLISRHSPDSRRFRARITPLAGLSKANGLHRGHKAIEAGSRWHRNAETRPICLYRGIPLPLPTGALLYDEHDFQRACQAYLWALPIVSAGEMERVIMQAPGAAYGDILSLVTFPALSRFLTANATTPYALTWLNLAQSGPYVIELPPGQQPGS